MCVCVCACSHQGSACSRPVPSVSGYGSFTHLFVEAHCQNVCNSCMVNAASLKQFNFPDWALNHKRMSNTSVFNSKRQKKELTLSFNQFHVFPWHFPPTFLSKKILKKFGFSFHPINHFPPLNTKKLKVSKVCNIINKYLRQPLKEDYSPNTFSWPLQAVFLPFLIKIKVAQINHLWEFLTLEISKRIKILQYKRLFFVLSLG